jgi:glycosyltransferase involved in cell wall biosynthesis
MTTLDSATTRGRQRRVISYGFLSTAPPTPCGLATFTAALGARLELQGALVHLVRVLDVPGGESASGFPVLGELIGSQPSTIASAASALNRCDVAVVQHEFGIFGGVDGADVVKVLDLVHVPVIAILHTVLQRPTKNQIAVMNAVLARVDVAVVMTEAAAKNLRKLHAIDSTVIEVIPHGAVVDRNVKSRVRGARPVILTWGLIGPGKGIEWAIDAMGELKDLQPLPLYIIAGCTHPKVLARQGDDYRRSLVQRTNAIQSMVRFDNTYRDLASLNTLIASADVVVLPYDSMDQATSGVLVDAVAAGCPVIATAFPHATELLSGGAGIIVPHGDPHALAQAIRRVITDSSLAADMASHARRKASSLSWRTVADSYQSVATRLLERVGVQA